MTENKFAWHVILDKFVDGVINEEERVELYRQMGKNWVKQEFFNRVTESDYHLKRLRLLLAVDDEEDLKRFHAAMDEYYKSNAKSK